MTNLLKNKNAFFERYGYCNDGLNNLDYWQFEHHIDLLNETLKREKEEYDKQQKEHKNASGNGLGNFNPNSMMSGIKNLGKGFGK